MSNDIEFMSALLFDAYDKASRLYRAADLPLILAAMVRHIKCAGVDLLQAA